MQANAPDSAEKQTDAPGWSEISMRDRRDFDVAFRDGAIILLSTPVATDCAGAPRPSKMPKEDVDTQETPLRS